MNSTEPFTEAELQAAIETAKGRDEPWPLTPAAPRGFAAQ